MRRKRHVLVTGGAGFIGSHIAAQLIKRGVKVTVADNFSTGSVKNIPAGADVIKADLGKESSYARLKGLACTGVMHLAGQSSGEASFADPLYDLRSHVMSTFFLLRWCQDNGVRRFQYASSMAAYGDPVYFPVDEKHPVAPKTYYAAAKLSAEAYIRFFRTRGMDTTIFRLFSVYGPGQNLANKAQGIVSIYLSYILEGKPIIVKGSPNRFRDLVYIDDVCRAWIDSVGDRRSYGKTYNLASGVKTTVSQLLRALREACGCPAHPIEFRDGTPGDQFGMVGDASLIRRELEWKAGVGLARGLASMSAFEKQRMTNRGRR